MAIWEVRVANVTKNSLRLSLDYEVIKDSNVVYNSSVTLEGDVIDLGAAKGQILKTVRRLKGIDEKAQTLVNLKTKTFTLTEDGSDLVLNQ